MIDVNEMQGATDNERIERAIASASDGEIVLIPKRKVDKERDWWLIDRAILLPKNTTVLLRNCKIKLSDRCRDNFFRSANCGIGIDDPEKTENIFIRGEGECILEGADHPRSTGDGGKILACPCPYFEEDVLAVADWVSEESKKAGRPTFWECHSHSYGTDIGNPNESHFGDWRNIGILLANVTNFSVENIKIVCSHGWGISLEACTNGYISKIEFDACMSKTIDGFTNNMENQDGIDVRNGCSHITIENITGKTGDDVIALTAIADKKYHPGGSLCTTHVMHNDWDRRDRDIHDVIIQNVRATSKLCAIVRFLACETKIYNVVVNNVIDTCPREETHWCGFSIGEGDGGYGKNLPGSISKIAISDVILHANCGLEVGGYLSDSVLSNIVNTCEGKPVLTVHRENGLENVKTSNLSET